MKYSKLLLVSLLSFQSSLMMTKSFLDLAAQCAPKVNQSTLNALVSAESSHNPYAIAIVKGPALQRQPTSLSEAIATIQHLEQNHINYSVGIAQINRGNFAKYGVTGMQLLDPCVNLQVAQKILQDCHARSGDIDKTLSCYYSGNFTRGFQADYNNSSYLQRVYAKRQTTDKDITIPSLKSQPPPVVLKATKSLKKIHKTSNQSHQKQYSMLDFEQ